MKYSFMTKGSTSRYESKILDEIFEITKCPKGRNILDHIKKIVKVYEKKDAR